MVVSAHPEERRCLLFNPDTDHGINTTYKAKLFVRYGLKGKLDVSAKSSTMSSDVTVATFWWPNCNKRRNSPTRISSPRKMCDG